MQPDGSTLGREQRIDSTILSMLNSRQVALQAVGANNLMEDPQPITPEDALLRDFSDTMDEYMPLYTGEVRTPVDDTWEGQGVIRIISSEPQPCTVRSLTLVLDREPGASRRQGG